MCDFQGYNFKSITRYEYSVIVIPDIFLIYVVLQLCSSFHMGQSIQSHTNRFYNESYYLALTLETDWTCISSLSLNNRQESPGRPT